MKSNVKSIPFNDGSGFVWWTWKETCDICGEVIITEEWQHSEAPNVTEKDYCLACMRRLATTGYFDKEKDNE